jgi:hypothetical protein
MPSIEGENLLVVTNRGVIAYRIAEFLERPHSKEFGECRYYRRTRSHRAGLSDGKPTGHDRMSLR